MNVVCSCLHWEFLELHLWTSKRAAGTDTGLSASLLLATCTQLTWRQTLGTLLQKARKIGVQDHNQPHSELETNLGSRRLCLKRKGKQMNKHPHSGFHTSASNLNILKPNPQFLSQHPCSSHTASFLLKPSFWYWQNHLPCPHWLIISVFSSFLCSERGNC